MGVISNNQITTIDIYSSTSAKNQIKRAIKYFQDCNPTERTDIILKITSVSVTTVFVCASGGMAIGAVSGAIAGSSMPVLGSSGGAVAGAQIGAIAGATFGIIIGTSVAVIKLSESNHYIQWKTRALKENVYPIFQEFLKNDEAFEDLICPLTYELPMVPVMSPNGHTYEKHAIEKWIDLHPDRSCPFKGKNFTKQDLVYNQKHVRKIVKKAKELLANQEMNQRPVIVEGLNAAHQTLKENNYEALRADSERVLKESYDHNVPSKVYSKLSSRIYNNYRLD